jgi:hypothetical protein
MSSASNRRRRGLGCAGISSLEFALVFVPFIWLMTGIFDIGRYFFTIQSMATLMSEAERYSMINPLWAPCGTDSWADAASLVPLLDSTQINLCVIAINGPGSAGAGGVSQVQLTVTYPFTAVTPGLGLLDHTSSNPLTQTSTISYLTPPPPQ